MTTPSDESRGLASRVGRLSKTPALRRSGWVLADQVFSSITNFALSVLIARNVSATEFGAFGVAFAVYLFLLALSTGMWSAPVAVTHAAVEDGDRLTQVARSAGAALVTGAATTPFIIVIALLVGGPIGEALVPMAIFMAGLMLQNAWRQGFVTDAEPRKAAINDIIWGVLQLGAVLAVIRLADSPTIGLLVAAWAGSGALAGLIACAQARRWPMLRGGMDLLRAHKSLGPNFVGEAIVTNGQSQVTLIALAAVSGVQATAGYRGAQVVFGPQRVLSNGLTLAALPETVRLRDNRARLGQAVLALSAVNTVVMVCVGAALMVLPDSIGRALLGATWTETVPVILPMTVFGITGTLASGPSVGLRAIGKANACLRNQAKVSPLALIFTVVGMPLGGAVGAAWGLALAGVIAAWIWISSWIRHFGEYDPAVDGVARDTTGASDAEQVDGTAVGDAAPDEPEHQPPPVPLWAALYSLSTPPRLATQLEDALKHASESGSTLPGALLGDVPQWESQPVVEFDSPTPPG